MLIDKETRGREIRWKKPKEPVNDREKWRNRAVCECKGMQVNRKSAESGCQSLSALFCLKWTKQANGWKSFQDV